MKPLKKHLNIKLVVDEIGELLVYLSRANYYLIAFGAPRGKIYIFKDFEGEIKGATTLPYKSSYGKNMEKQIISV